MLLTARPSRSFSKPITRPPVGKSGPLMNCNKSSIVASGLSIRWCSASTTSPRLCGGMFRSEAHHQTAGGKIGAFDELQQIVNSRFRIVDQVVQRIDNFTQVVRRHVQIGSPSPDRRWENRGL